MKLPGVGNATLIVPSGFGASALQAAASLTASAPVPGATFGGGGGLGVLITTGITNQRMPVLMLGSILTIALALLVDWLASLAELLLRPRGLEVRS